MQGGNGTGLILNITIQAVQDGSDYDSRLRINSVTSYGTGYEAGDLLTIPGIPYNPAPIKLFSATETIDNSAGEIFNTRQGIGTYLYKEGTQVTANDPIPVSMQLSLLLQHLRLHIVQLDMLPLDAPLILMLLALRVFSMLRFQTTMDVL